MEGLELIGIILASNAVTWCILIRHERILARLEGYVQGLKNGKSNRRR